MLPPGSPAWASRGLRRSQLSRHLPARKTLWQRGLVQGRVLRGAVLLLLPPPAPALGFAALHNERELAVSIQKSGKRNVGLYFRRLARKKMPCASPWLKLE